MGWVTAGVIIAAAAATYGASEQHKAGTTAGHGRKRAAGKAKEAEEKAKKEQAAIALAGKEQKQRLAAGVGRNVTMFTSPLGMAGQAQIARKTLTGQ